MNYKLILLFLFALLTDYFVFFPLSGTKETLIVPVLLVAIAVTADYNSMLLAGFLFSGAAELIGGFNTGTLILPFLGVALIYFGMDKFLSLKSAQYSFQDGDFACSGARLYFSDFVFYGGKIYSRRGA